MQFLQILAKFRVTWAEFPRVFGFGTGCNVIVYEDVDGNSRLQL